MLKSIAIAVALLTIAAFGLEQARAQRQSSQDYVIGAAEMSADGVVTVTFVPTPANPNPPEPRYGEMIARVGGLSPGQSKGIHRQGQTQ